jgi:hypothetical protein
LRVFNPTGEAVREAVSFSVPLASAVFVDLEGHEREPAAIRADGQIELQLRPKQIVTLAVRLET